MNILKINKKMNKIIALDSESELQDLTPRSLKKTSLINSDKYIITRFDENSSVKITIWMLSVQRLI